MPERLCVRLGAVGWGQIRRVRDTDGDTPNPPRFEGEALEANLALVDLVTKVAERKNATVGQVALAWLLAQKPWIVPIPGTRRLERLDENLGSVDLDLTLDDLAELDNATVTVQVQGDRYPEALLTMIGR